MRTLAINSVSDFSFYERERERDKEEYSGNAYDLKAGSWLEQTQIHNSFSVFQKKKKRVREREKSLGCYSPWHKLGCCLYIFSCIIMEPTSNKLFSDTILHQATCSGYFLSCFCCIFSFVNSFRTVTRFLQLHQAPLQDQYRNISVRLMHSKSAAVFTL